MQELTFEQVESVSGGYLVVSGSELQNIMQELTRSNQLERECELIDPQPISPGAQALMAFISGVAAGKNVVVGAALGALSAWMSATAGSSSQFCPQKTMTQDDLANAINEGLSRGGPF